MEHKNRLNAGGGAGAGGGQVDIPGMKIGMAKLDAAGNPTGEMVDVITARVRMHVFMDTHDMYRILHAAAPEATASDMNETLRQIESASMRMNAEDRLMLTVEHTRFDLLESKAMLAQVMSGACVILPGMACNCGCGSVAPRVGYRLSFEISDGKATVRVGMDQICAQDLQHARDFICQCNSSLDPKYPRVTLAALNVGFEQTQAAVTAAVLAGVKHCRLKAMDDLVVRCRGHN